MHAYTILQTVTLSNGTRLIQMRNPWGSETYHGVWRDYPNAAGEWTDQWKEEAGFESENDGSWFTSIEQYHQSFSETHMNANIDDEKMNYYAAFETGPSVRETLVVTSPVAQTIYVSAYTYDIQHIRNGQCSTGASGTTLKVIS